eukprot:gene7347-14996_t
MSNEERYHFVKIGTAKTKLLELTEDSFLENNRARTRKSDKHASHNYPILSQPSAPSIPVKLQAHGYVESPDGKMRPQDPLPLGFSGVHGDTAGPGDYDPKLVKQIMAPRAVFPKSTRQSVTSSIDWVGVNMTTPGPGQYNSKSSFDDALLPADYESDEDSSNKYLTTAFRSTTKRELCMTKSLREAREEPGPAAYTMSSTLRILHKPKSQQCFSSSSSRFRDPTARSLRLSTAPGLYDVISSDFDLNRRRIQKQKQLLKSSEWAQSVGFTTSSNRFSRDEGKDTGPSPLSYTVQNGTVGSQSRRTRDRSKVSPFGSSAKRFHIPVGDITSHEMTVAANLSDEALDGQAAAPGASPDGRAGGGHNSRTMGNKKHTPAARKLGLSSFLNNEARISQVAYPVPVGPPVGTYSLESRWDAKGVSIAPPIETAEKAPSPGPGQYVIPSLFDSANSRNRKNILGSTGGRFEYKPREGPGPGAYDPIPLGASMLLPSHNVSFYNNS